MKLFDLNPYIELIESFLSNQISPFEFQRKYLDMFKEDDSEGTEEEYEVLNDLFGDVDAFYADPELRGPDDLDENGLRRHSEIALKKLILLRNHRRLQEP